MAKSYWKKEYDKHRNGNDKIISFRVSEDEAMEIFGEASNQGISVSRYVKNKVLHENKNDYPEE